MQRRSFFARGIRVYLRLRTIIYAHFVGAHIGRGVIIWPGARLSQRDGGSIIIGDRSQIHPGAMLLTYGGDIHLGKRCSVNPYTVLYGHGGLHIGDNVRIAAHCTIIPANHGTNADALIADQPLQKNGVYIGGDVWLGAGVRVLDGAHIETGCVVAAGAVVRGVLKRGGVYGGVPARLLKMRQGEPVKAEAEAMPS